VTGLLKSCTLLSPAVFLVLTVRPKHHVNQKLKMRYILGNPRLFAFFITRLTG
jgi:hypothetical protein